MVGSVPEVEPAFPAAFEDGWCKPHPLVQSPLGGRVPELLELPHGELGLDF